jgi:hypothetical protein
VPIRKNEKTKSYIPFWSLLISPVLQEYIPFRAVIERPVGSVENLRYLEWGVKMHAGGDWVILEADSSRLTFETALAMFSQPVKQREKTSTLGLSFICSLESGARSLFPVASKSCREGEIKWQM